MELVILLIVSYAGMFLHFIKKAMKDNSAKTISDLKKFLRTESLYTLFSFISVTIAIILLYFGIKSEATIYASFITGYGIDSVVNKWESGNERDN